MTTVHKVKSPAQVRMPGYAKLAGVPLAEWEGNCFGIASKLAAHFGGVAVYGHWRGEISAKAKFWAAKRGAGFAQHGWIVLPSADGNYGVSCETIIDPTRWSFEAKKPYIWRGKNDGTYDEGGNEMRKQLRRAGPPDVDDGRDPVILELGCDEQYDKVRRICRMGVFSEFSAEYPYIYHSDLAWLANAPPGEIGWFEVAEIYEAIAQAGGRTYIPIDNWKMVHRRFGLKGGA